MVNVIEEMSANTAGRVVEMSEGVGSIVSVATSSRELSDAITVKTQLMHPPVATKGEIHGSGGWLEKETGAIVSLPESEESEEPMRIA